jgi:hypothetical protein
MCTCTQRTGSRSPDPNSSSGSGGSSEVQMRASDDEGTPRNRCSSLPGNVRGDGEYGRDLVPNIQRADFPQKRKRRSVALRRKTTHNRRAASPTRRSEELAREESPRDLRLGGTIQKAKLHGLYCARQRVVLLRQSQIPNDNDTEAMDYSDPSSFAQSGSQG